MLRAFLIFLITITASFAAEQTVKEEVSLTPTNKLTFTHPDRIRYDVVRQPDDGFRPALRFRCFDTNGISDLSFKIFVGKDDGSLKTQADVEAAVKTMGTEYVSQSVEKTNTVKRIQQKSGLGAYSVFTDADLAGVPVLRPGQFRHITLGLAKSGDFVFTIRGYSNSKDGNDYKSMLEVIDGLNIEKRTPEEKPKESK